MATQAGDVGKSFSLQNASEVFKKVYVKRSDSMYNSDNVLQGRIKKSYDFTGSEKLVETHLSFSGGVGSAVLPRANAGKYAKAKITSNKVYGRALVEREAMKASSNDKGAFVKATAEQVRKTVESYMRNQSRILFGDGTSILGRIDNTVTVKKPVSAASTTITITEASWKEANWEERDFVQLVSGMSSYPNNSTGTAEGGTSKSELCEILEVNPTTREITIDASNSTIMSAFTHNSVPGNAGYGLCMQNSYQADPQGFKSIFDESIAFKAGTPGTIYDIPTQRRWTAHTEDAGGAGINPDLLNLVMLQVKKRSGKYPNMIMTGYEQSRNIKAFLEDQKVYNLPNRNLKGHAGFRGIEYVHDDGSIGLFVDRFCDEDKVYFLNDNFIHVHHRPGFGWFDDDGTVFLRLSDDDQYEARYGGYYENFITPTFHGFLHNLAV